jgi:hypothetical protein
MKKTLFFGGLVLIGLVACKKDWDCECTRQDMPAADKVTYKYTIKEENRQTAYRACVHTQQTHTVEVLKNNQFVVETRTLDVYCEIK